MVEYETQGAVAVVTIDRPEARNAIDNATAGKLQEAWKDFDNDDSLKAGVLTGRGDDAFSAGADLNKMDLEDRDEGYLGFTRMTVSKPVVAAVEGYCVAGGLEMALWCDLRVASRTAEFGCLERRFGVPLVDGGTQRLPRIVGLGRALELILDGEPIDAQTAREWGLVNRVVEPGESRKNAVKWAEKLVEFPQETLRSDRRAVYEGLGKPLDEGLEIERQLGNESLETAMKGAREFAEGTGRHGTFDD